MNTADGSPMSALGATALHLRITKFKFTHNFIICNQLPESELIQNDLDLLLHEYESQFAKDETSIGTTPLTSMTIDTGTPKPISQKPYPIALKHYQWVKEEIE